MFTPRRILRTITTLLIALAAAATASPAFAYPVGDGADQQAPIPVPVAPAVSQISYGSPIWVFGLVVAVTAALTVAAVVSLRRFMAKRPSTLLNV
jgi:hypothetical protein